LDQWEGRVNGAGARIAERADGLAGGVEPFCAPGSWTRLSEHGEQQAAKNGSMDPGSLSGRQTTIVRADYSGRPISPRPLLVTRQLGKANDFLFGNDAKKLADETARTLLPNELLPSLSRCAQVDLGRRAHREYA